MLRRSSPPDLSDEDLSARVADGDPRSLEILFDRHADAAFSLAYRVCGRRELAEQIVQDAFVTLWRTAGSGHDQGAVNVRSRILNAVHERAIDVLRQLRAGERAGRRVQLLGSSAANAARPPALRPDGDSATLRARQALAQLPSQEQRVIELAYFSGLTHRQIAQLLDLPDKAVARSLRSGVQTLHGLLEAGGGQPPALVERQPSLSAAGGDPQQARSRQPGDLALGQLG